MNRIVIWLFLLTVICESWSIPKSMESIQKVTIKTAVPQGDESTKKPGKIPGFFSFGDLLTL